MGNGTIAGVTAFKKIYSAFNYNVEHDNEEEIWTKG